MGFKKENKEKPYVAKDAVTETDDKLEVIDTEVNVPVIKVGDEVKHKTFGVGKVIRFSTVDHLIGDFGGSLRTIPVTEVELLDDTDE